MASNWKQTVEIEANAVIAFIQKHPKTGAALAFALGLVIGRLLLVHLL